MNRIYQIKIRGQFLMGLSILMGFLAFRCATVKTKSMDQKTATITLEKGGCLGRCPVYVMTIYDDHSISFQSYAHTLVDSMEYGEISEQQFTSLIGMFEKSHFVKLDSNYSQPIIDAPITHLTYRNPSTTHKVSCRGDAPAVFSSLVNEIEIIAAKLGWLPQLSNTQGLRSEVIVELDRERAPESVISQFEDLDMLFVRKIVPGKLYFLYSIAGERNEDVLQKIRENPMVKSAQWNHKLKKRDR